MHGYKTLFSSLLADESPAAIVVADSVVAATSHEKFKGGRKVPFFRRRGLMLPFRMVKKTDENQGNNLKLLSMSSERQGVYNIASYITKHTSELR